MTDAAHRAGVSPGRPSRRRRQGQIPQYDGCWTPAAVGHATVVARQRGCGHSRRDIRAATTDGRVAFGYIEELLPHERSRDTLQQAARETARFVESIATTLPGEARVIKTSGDEVMIVGSDPVALTDWAVALQAERTARPLSRIAIHYGEAVYRDCEYYERDVNIASRVAARSAGGEVLVTRPSVDSTGGELAFERIGEIRRKGFTESSEIFLAAPGGEP